MRSWRIFVIPLSVAALCSVVTILTRPVETEFPLALVPTPPQWTVNCFGCSPTPNPYSAAAKYPVFTSAKPLFGTVYTIHREPDDDGENSREHRFATGGRHAFVIDESRGTGQGYDTLYFDSNANSDLSDDVVHRRLAQPPPEYRLRPQDIFFDNIELPFDYGSAGGRWTFVVVAYLVPDPMGMFSSPIAGTISSSAITGANVSVPANPDMSYSRLACFPAFGRQGKVRIGGPEYEALLTLPILNPRYDLPGTYVLLVRKRWFGLTRFFPFFGHLPPERLELNLGSSFSVGKRRYKLTVTPSGDKLTVTKVEP